MPSDLESDLTGVNSELATLATLADERETTSAASLGPGARLGRYELEEQLGAGAMGSVFSAHDPLLDRRVALKVLHPDRRGARAVQRLQREARSLARLSHPNVVTINDVGVGEELVYLAMELVDGQTLGAWLAAEERPWRRVVEVMVQAGQGLAAVHEAGLVHRDFKPENIMIASDGRVLLADFGIALAASEAASVEVTQRSAEIIASVSVEEGPRLTRTGALLGTPRYMAPEQFLKLPVDARADQWAFSVVLWEALFGMHPFGGETVAEIGLAVTTGARREPPSDHRVPPSIVQAMLKGFSVSGTRRFASMQELLEQLDVGRSSRRRWWLAGVGAVGAAAGLVASSMPSSELPCDGRARMAEVWNDERSARVERAFEAASLPLAAATQGRVLSRIDDYRDEWVASYEDACEAQQGADVERQARLDRRFTCLNERREALEHLVGVLEEADETVVTHASGAVLGLEPVRECDDWQDSDSAAVPLPSDPELREDVQRVSAMIGDVRALDAAGRYEDAAALARRAHEAGSTVDHPPLHAITLVTLGIAKSHAVEDDDGHGDFERAIEIAGAEGMGAVVARAAVLLSMAQTERAEVDAARLSLRHAEAALHRMGKSPQMDPDFLSGRVGLCKYEGDYARCEQIQRRILSLNTEYYGARSSEAAGAHGRLAHLVGERGRHDEAIQHYQAQRQILAEVLGPNHPAVASTLSLIQDQYRAQGDYERAREIDALVLPMMEAAYGPEHPRLLNSVIHRATLLAVDGDAEESLEYYDRGLRILEKSDGPEHPRVASLLGNRSIILGRLGRHDQAISDLRRALRILEIHLEPEHPHVAIVHDNLGHALVLAGRPAEAVPYHERALPIWEAQDRHSADTAICLTDYGRALIGAGRPAEAVPMLERAIGIFGAHTIDPAEVARARFALARALADEGREPERARSLAERARDVYRAQENREAERLEIEAWLGSGPDAK